MKKTMGAIQMKSHLATQQLFQEKIIGGTVK
jgi:hypothetical protein